MTNEVDADQLKKAVEGLHHCTATLAAIVEVHERFDDKPVWGGVVHVFDLTGHTAAKRAYAWSSPVEGSDRRKFYAVLELPPVTSPVEAIRAAIMSQNRLMEETVKPIEVGEWVWHGDEYLRVKDKLDGGKLTLEHGRVKEAADDKNDDVDLEAPSIATPERIVVNENAVSRTKPSKTVF